MACSVPVIVAEGVGSKVELVEEGRTGFVFPNGDDRVLADTLEKLREEPGQRQKMGARSLQKARVFDYEFSTAQMMAALGVVD